jgi:hypothetical protein
VEPEFSAFKAEKGLLAKQDYRGKAKLVITCEYEYNVKKLLRQE